MVILHKEDESKGTFYIEKNGELLAEMVYRKEKDKMTIDHTEVDESLHGQNIGFQLIEKGVEFARTNCFKIIPLCVFAKKVIEEHKEFQDVL